MARQRLRAAARKARDKTAAQIGQGVYTVALDLNGRTLPLPIYVTAPLVYVAEMLAIAKAVELGRGGDREFVDRVAHYYMAGMQELAVAMTSEFDVAHMEEWSAAADRVG